MEAFSLKLESLRENGIGLGMDDKDIDCCMLEALRGAKQQLTTNSDRSGKKTTKGTRQPKERQPVQKRRRKLTTLCLTLCLGIVGLLVFMVIFNILVENFPSLEYFVGRYMEPVFSECIWYWRLATLPLARTFDLSGYYSQQCLVFNPFRAPPEVSCKEYKHAPEVVSLVSLSEETFQEKYLGTVKAFIMKKKHQAVPYTTLRSWHRENEDFLNSVPTNLDSSSKTFPDAWSLSRVLSLNTGNDIKAKQDFHALWVASSVNPSRLLRQLFPRPEFIPGPFEVFLSKMLFVDSPHAESYDPLSSAQEPFYNIWYVQGSGTRQIYLTPNYRCESEGQPIAVTMEAGDMLYIHTPYWNIQSRPVEDNTNTDVGVAFLGAFM